MTIGPKALKDMIDHFPSTKSAKTDPQLTWAFDESEVRVRTLETSVDMKGIGYTLLATPLSWFNIC